MLLSVVEVFFLVTGTRTKFCPSGSIHEVLTILNYMHSDSPTGLPNELQSKLNQAWPPHRRDSSEVRAISCVSIGLLKLRVVPRVKKLYAKLRDNILRYARCLPNSEVPVVQARTINSCRSGVPEVACRRDRETTGIEPGEAIVANVARKLTAAPIAHTIG